MSLVFFPPIPVVTNNVLIRYLATSKSEQSHKRIIAAKHGFAIVEMRMTDHAVRMWPKCIRGRAIVYASHMNYSLVNGFVLFAQSFTLVYYFWLHSAHIKIIAYSSFPLSSLPFFFLDIILWVINIKLTAVRHAMAPAICARRCFPHCPRFVRTLYSAVNSLIAARCQK